MADRPLRRYIFASDFDQTLTFNDSGYALAELVGIPTDDFERKAKGMAKINLVQQGAELAYLLLHDPEFQHKVRKEHLHEVGKKIRLKSDIKLLYQILEAGVDGHFFDFYVLSAAPVEVIHSALEGIVPRTTFSARNFAINLPAKSTPSSAPPPATARLPCSISCWCSRSSAPIISSTAATEAPTFT
jgi:2-hydroxy-3-keto-5-methylthiopentenyl-1-phosphate phosphatase